MALPESGRLTMTDIVTEFGGNPPHKLSEYYGVGTVPASGRLAFSDFHGVSSSLFPVTTVTRFGNPTSNSNSYFGVSVTISDDGNTFVVGALGDTEGGSYAGAIFVYSRLDEHSEWSNPPTKLIPSDTKPNLFLGRGVKISGDGNVIFVDAYVSDDIYQNSGSAYIYVRNGSSWHEIKLLAPTPRKNALFGNEAMLSYDGSVIAIGEYKHSLSVSDGGAIHVYSRSGYSLTKTATLAPATKYASLQFGESFTMDTAGNKLVVGCPSKYFVYTFIRSGSTWVEQPQILKSSDIGITDIIYFGEVVALSGDGNTLAIGTPRNASPEHHSGEINVFTYINSEWVYQAKLQHDSGLASTFSDRFGASIGISSSGDIIVSGAENTDLDSITKSGSAYIFTRTNSVWTQQSIIQAPIPVASSLFGSYVAMSSESNVAVVGAYAEQSSTGAVYVVE